MSFLDGVQAYYHLIPGFPEYYISRAGEIWSAKRAGRFLKPCKNNKYGHLVVSLCQNGKCYQRLVHRLVLEAFVGPCPPGMECCHYNGNSADNRLENLRWDTRSNNQKDRWIHGTSNRGEKHGQAKLNALQVRIIKHLLKTKEFSLREIGKIFGVSDGAVSDNNTGKNWKHI